MKKSRKIVGISLILLLVTSIIGVWYFNNNKQTSKTYTVLKDEKFGAVHLDTSLEDFFNDGFELGDSLNLSFSNGYVLNDLPLYSGYYVKAGGRLVVAYPGYEHIAVAKSSDVLWDEVGAKQGDTCTVTLNEKGKYLNVQEALSQSYSYSRDDYESDIVFANFRCLSGGNIKENKFYRGASPFDNENNRAYEANNLVKENGIKFILNLADSQDDISNYFADENFKSEYAKQLYENDKVAVLDLTAAYMNDTFKQTLADGLRKMMKNDGPVYIHCTEGKDRSGFVSLLFEGLSGATYDEMLLDYMTTYKNYYGITKETAPDKYNAIVDVYFNAYFENLLNSDDVSKFKDADFVEACKNYLLSSGLTELEISDLIKYICE